MYQDLLRSTSWFELLFRLDVELAEEAGRKACRYCADKLHRGDYERKPRGLPPRGIDEREWSRRFSLCCAGEGCRKRETPPSFRFLGRRVYAAAVIVLVSALRCGPTPARVERLSELVGAGPQTISRWITWWREGFVGTALWRAARGRVSADEKELPLSLLEQFLGVDAGARVIQLLRVLLPLTTLSSGVSF